MNVDGFILKASFTRVYKRHYSTQILRASPAQSLCFQHMQSDCGHREWTQSRRCEPPTHPLLEYLVTLPGNGWGVFSLNTHRWLCPFGFSFSYVLLISCTLRQLCLLRVHIPCTLPDFAVVSTPSIGVLSFFSASSLCVTPLCGGGGRCIGFRLYASSRSNRTPLVVLGCVSSGTRITV